MKYTINMAAIKAHKNVKKRCKIQLGMINKPNVVFNVKKLCFDGNQINRESCRTYKFKESKKVSIKYILNFILKTKGLDSNQPPLQHES